MTKTFHVPLFVLLAVLTGSPAGATPASYVNTTNQQSSGFQDGTMDSFFTCTTELPNYNTAYTNNGSPCAQFYWQADGYNGTRDLRGTEACSSLSCYKEGWYGFYLYLPSFNTNYINSYPTNKQAGCAQIFQNGYCGGSWAALMIVTNNSLFLNYRSYCGTPPNYYVKIADAIPRDTWVPIIIHFVASHLNTGMMQVWFDGASESSPTYGATNINFGFGTWNSDDTLVSTNPLSFKFGQYDYDDGNYTTNETRTSYYGNVCQMVDPIPANAFAVANPGLASPPGLTAQNGGSVKVLVSWGSVSNAASYNIYRNFAGNGTYLLVSNLTSTSFIDADVTNGTTYYYIVTASNSVTGESPNPTPAMATPDPGLANITWVGNLNNLWDIDATANWRSNVTSSIYLDGDNLTFNDSASNSVIDLTDTVSPGSMTVSNNALNYVIGSSTGDSISGAASLTKFGTNTLTFSGLSNYFGGGLTMNAGTFDLSGGTNSAGAVTLAGGTIQNGALIGGSYSLQAGAISASLAGNGAATKTGSGTVTLSGSNTLSGATAVNIGTLVLSGNNSGATTPITIAGSAILRLAHSNAVAASTVTMGSGTTIQLRSDADTRFATAGLGTVPYNGILNFDADQVTSAGSNSTLTLSGALAESSATAGSGGFTLNVTGGHGCAVGLGALGGGNGTTTTLNPTTGNLIIASYTGVGNSSTLQFTGSGNTTVTGGITNGPGNKSLGFNFNQTGKVTLRGVAVTASGNGVAINSGTVVLNNNLGFSSQSGAPTLGLVTGTGTNTGAALLLGGTDANGLLGGITLSKNIIVEDGGATPNNGTLFLGGQNTSGTNAFSGSITLGATANTGKSVTLLAATGGEVDFTGIIATNGTDTTAGVTVGNSSNAGIVKLAGANTYAGPTTLSNGTLIVTTAHHGGGSLSVRDGTVLSVINTGLAQSAAFGNFALGNAAGQTTLRFTNFTSTTVAFISAAAATVTGTNTIQVASTNGLVSGNVYPLVKYASLAGFGNLGLSLPVNTAAVLTNDAVHSWIVLKVINAAVNTNITAISFTNSVGQIQLSWPSGHTGWRLLEQTNGLAGGLSSNPDDWDTANGSAATNQVSLPINPNLPAEFYRLVYP